ncbi:PH domain-containing protein [Frankia sp. AiPa1]|uniref:PH domain-containing protein n=1 Tax=Frankia sp. AiPa1 TaxID=573492 RepID=UPI00202B1745|nr:PH domain-containing protein [Frankia sp. AiPa1]MCL9761930.1 PH domain-containing protein [Frankia sp. AiPa1]
MSQTAPGADTALDSGPDSGPDALPNSRPDGAADCAPDPALWRILPPGLRRLRRTLLLLVAVPAVAITALVSVALGGWPWVLLTAVPISAAGWAWLAIGRIWRAWRYAERQDDLLISRGVLVRRLVVVPYGRMQLVDVTAGPLARRFGIARVQLHTAAATSDALIPGLRPQEAARLRDALTERGEARSAGL